MRPQCNTFPIGFLAEGKLAVVVGAGRVGLRKTRSLLDAGFRVRVVAPKMLVEFDALPIERSVQAFMPEHLVGAALVIACTDERSVNRHVREVAREANVLCCRADGAWHEGDFIVPAQLRTEDFLLSVSTSGRSCRTAKELRDAIAQHLSHCTAGQFVIYGAPAADLTLPEDAVLAHRLALVTGIYGWVTLRTCDRTELLAWCTQEVISSGILQVLFPLREAKMYQGRDAERHFAFVLAGMRARLAGEFHIIGQVRDAFNNAREAGHLNGALQETYALAQQRAQVLRAAITPHLPEVALEALTLRDVKGRVVIAGTGALAKAIWENAKQQQLEVTLLHHRTPWKDSLPLEQWREAVQGADRLISALRTPTPYFDAAEIPCAIYDLGAPRNVKGENVMDLDALRVIAFEEAGVRREDLERIADDAWMQLG